MTERKAQAADAGETTRPDDGPAAETAGKGKQPGVAGDPGEPTGDPAAHVPATAPEDSADGTADLDADPAPLAAPAPAPPAAAPTEPRKVRTRPSVQPRTVEPNAALREAPEDGHVAVVDQHGNPLDVDELFHDGGGHQTWVTAKTRIFQQFRYPHTTTVTTQLLYPQGARVPRDHAERLRATLRRTEPEQAPEG